MEEKEGKSVFQLYYDDMKHARQAGIKELMTLWRKLASENESVKIPAEIESQLKKWGIE